ncbi:non-hydrolyzing UDP-N-acetylglucosamine 2-epimerase [uncultured Thiohalocapsa sp.]|uniref:non-hydrolyzing UDP-N-acetylglucosamine 2-epimerase n=1 Tax=uncultured Thiohalocapsa sp. TaxID=768990 RepID=UPI0025D22361|nr:UDP-N-acetylglucosamine 2-epimerase (non-hydrolyzing) [uncultured Thiohalocapsa sp.]
MTKRVMCVVGARPNFMKIAPLMRRLQASASLEPYLVHTGQHYDAAMKAAFFDALRIPEPDEDLGVGSGTHAAQTAEIMRRFEPVLDAEAPAAVLVVGDVNSTIACALVAAKKGVPVVHVEAGLRSFDRSMPEEINRVLTDQLSAALFTTERRALDNLAREGVDPDRVHFVGNVMIDTLMDNRARAPSVAQVLAAVSSHEAPPERFGVVTLHRPSNVDDPAVLERLLAVLAELSGELPLLFPLHPRTAARLEGAGLLARAQEAGTLLPPLDYLQMLGLLQNATMVLTDSGGIQEETTALGVPCLTLRANTERPITVEQGTNSVVGSDPERILAAARGVLRDGGKAGRIPELWDGQAADRIVAVLENWLDSAVSPTAGPSIAQNY